MTVYTDYARILRGAGLKVVEVEGWKSRTRPGGKKGRLTLVAHHTATSNRAAGNMPTLNILRTGYGGLPGPLSQLGLGRDGTWYVVAGGRCNHAGLTFLTRQSNSYAIGVEAEHSGSGPWPEKQYDSYVRGCAALMKSISSLKYLEGHKEIAKPRGRKTDPNFSMAQFRLDVQKAIATGDFKTTPKPAGIAALGGLLTEDGILDANTIKAFQRVWGSDPDGYWGPNTAKAMQTWLGVDADGIFGKKTFAALAKRVGLSSITSWDVKTKASTPVTKAIEAQLNREWREHTTPKSTTASTPVLIPASKTTPKSSGSATIDRIRAAKSGYFLTVNGALNTSTVRYLQAFMNAKDLGRYKDVAEDGKWGPETIKKLQWLVGVSQDGVFGPASRAATEKWLGIKSEPKMRGWYPGLTRGVQRRLNYWVREVRSELTA